MLDNNESSKEALIKSAPSLKLICSAYCLGLKLLYLTIKSTLASNNNFILCEDNLFNGIKDIGFDNLFTTMKNITNLN